MNFIDNSKFGKYLFNWNKKEQTGGDIKMNEEEHIQPFNGGAGFPLVYFDVIKKDNETHISRFKDLVVPIGLVLEK